MASSSLKAFVITKNGLAVCVVESMIIEDAQATMEKMKNYDAAMRFSVPSFLKSKVRWRIKEVILEVF